MWRKLLASLLLRFIKGMVQCAQLPATPLISLAFISGILNSSAESNARSPAHKAAHAKRQRKPSVPLAEFVILSSAETHSLQSGGMCNGSSPTATPPPRIWLIWKIAEAKTLIRPAHPCANPQGIHSITHAECIMAFQGEKRTKCWGKWCGNCVMWRFCVESVMSKWCLSFKVLFQICVLKSVVSKVQCESRE